MNDMRDKLIELLNFVQCKAECCSALDGGRCGDLDHLDRCQIETISDHLLENGVIAPPCKVGDTVYFSCLDENCEKFIDKGRVYAISQNENTLWFSVRYLSGLRYDHTASDFGKTVFLTREAAKQALRGRESNA